MVHLVAGSLHLSLFHHIQHTAYFQAISVVVLETARAAPSGHIQSTQVAEKQSSFLPCVRACVRMRGCVYVWRGGGWVGGEDCGAKGEGGREGPLPADPPLSHHWPEMVTPLSKPTWQKQGTYHNRLKLIKI